MAHIPHKFETLPSFADPIDDAEHNSSEQQLDEAWDRRAALAKLGSVSSAEKSLDQQADTPIDAVRLIGAVSHEMRNPLNGILGMAHLLAETQLDGAQRNYLDGIQTSGTVLLTLVNDLLDLTALQSSTVAMTLAPSDIDHLINQTLELAAPRAHGKGLALGSFVDVALHDDPVSIDAGRVRQILTNLVTNAIKFTDSGGVRLDATVADASADSLGRTELVFTVSDTGHGIAAKEQELIFQPFGRTQSAHSNGTEGTGLGLPLSRGLAHAMGGDLVLVSSKPGAGTCMQLRLPLPDGDVPRARARGEQILAGERVLIASTAQAKDRRSDRVCPETAALRDTLVQLGAEVRLLEDIGELNGAPQAIDHVLIDAHFDHAMLWARLCLPGTGVRPVIMLKPDERAMLPDLRDAGFSGYLVRPVRQASLIAMLTDRFGTHDDDAFLADPADESVFATPTPRQTEAQYILLADDNPVNTLLAKTALEKAGHHVTSVDDGARAIAHVLQRHTHNSGGAPFDTVILDLSMPVLDGFAAARQMRAAGYDGRIVALSGNTDPDLETQLKNAGFDGFVQKPIMPETLQKLVGSPRGQ